MPIGYIFWTLMILWFVFGLYWNRPGPANPGATWGDMGGHFLQFVLFALLGWHVFGPVVK
jgi:hypothetical protein